MRMHESDFPPIIPIDPLSREISLMGKMSDLGMIPVFDPI